ncbi:hypothetical protein ACC754_38820, partial [Rhizobium johnstonii]
LESCGDIIRRLGVSQSGFTEVILLILNNRLNWQQLLSTRGLGQHGLKLGVDNVYLVKATYTGALTLRMQAVAALGSAMGTSNKAINQVTAH